MKTGGTEEQQRKEGLHTGEGRGFRPDQKTADQFHGVTPEKSVNWL